VRRSHNFRPSVMALLRKRLYDSRVCEQNKDPCNKRNREKNHTKRNWHNKWKIKYPEWGNNYEDIQKILKDKCSLSCMILRENIVTFLKFYLWFNQSVSCNYNYTQLFKS